PQDAPAAKQARALPVERRVDVGPAGREAAGRGLREPHEPPRAGTAARIPRRDLGNGDPVPLWLDDVREQGGTARGQPLRHGRRRQRAARRGRPARALGGRAGLQYRARVRLAVRGGLVVTERETRRADVIVAGERIEAVLDPGAGAGGVVGVKAFMCPSGVDEFAHLDPDALEPALHAAAAAGLLVAVHAEDEDAVAHATRELRAAGRRDPAAWEPSRPIPAEVRAIECLGRAARIGGATVHVVHASNAGAVDAAARCRIAGARMTIETCPHYLTFAASDLGRIGPPLKCAPPVRTSAERERLWRSVREGAVDLVASDHSPCPRELKERGDIWDGWGGGAGVQFTLAALLTEGVHRRGLGESALARLL